MLLSNNITVVSYARHVIYNINIINKRLIGCPCVGVRCGVGVRGRTGGEGSWNKGEEKPGLSARGRRRRTPVLQVQSSAG